MFTIRTGNLTYVFLAFLIVALISLPTATSAAVPQGFTPTPTNTSPPPTDTPPPTDIPPPPTDTPLPTDTPPPTDTPTPTATDGTIVPPPPTSPSPTPTSTTPITPTATEPPREEPEPTETQPVPLLPVTGQLPPDAGDMGSGSSKQLVALLFAFLTALVIGFTGGKRIREWLSSIGILGAILFLLPLSFGLAFWSSSPSYAAVENSAVEKPGQVYSSAPATSNVKAALVLDGPSLEYKLRKSASKSGSIVSSASPAKMDKFHTYASKMNRSASIKLDATAVQRIKIPALKVDTGVVPAPFDGVTWDVSDIGGEVAWLERTSQPGLGGNTVLAGHITARDIGNGPFRYLNGLPVGEYVYLFTENNLYKYRVRAFRIVTAQDGSVTAATDDSQLTLVTCSSWDELANQYTKRRVVFADLVEVKYLHDTRTTYQAH